MRTLYLIDLYGEKYGIWKDEVASVRDVREVHHLPLSPASVAGIAVLEGRSTALVDLGASIGLRPAAGGISSRALFVSGKSIDTGFLVPGTMEEAEIPPGAMFAMPECVSTSDIDTCAVIGPRPVPVFNLVRTYERIHEHATSPSPTQVSLTAAPQVAPEIPETVRLITVGGEEFAIPAASLRGEPVRLGGIAKVALAPRFIRGVAFHDNGILPVIDLAVRMGLSVSGGGQLMLVTEVSGAAFGLIIDGDKGTVRGGEFNLKPLPPIAATGWARGAVLCRGPVVPLIDLAGVLSRHERNGSLAELPEGYAPDSRFPQAFERQSVDVIEFSLLGVRHAIPKAEVEDVLSWRPYRGLPDALPIVIGVTEHNGEVLPVLDLALVFGRRSLETREWSMVLVKNGDFRALVITEEVYGERTLPRDVQRKVPIVLPHNLVYGCYPEGIAVRLILNVEAIAVHFDRSVVEGLLPALTPEMAASPAELVPSLLPEEHVRETAAAAAFEPAGSKLGMAAPGQAAEQTLIGMEEQRGGTPEEKAGVEEKIRVAEEQARREAGEEARAAAEEEAKRESDERERQEAAERVRREEEAKARLETEERRQQEALTRTLRETEEKTRQEAEARAKHEADERAQREAEERARLEDEEKKRREAEVLERRTAEERSRLQKEQTLREEEERKQAQTEAMNRQEAEDRERREQTARTAAEAEEKSRQEAGERSRLESQERARAAADSIREAEDIKKKKEAEAAPAVSMSYRDRAPSAFPPGPSPDPGKPFPQGPAGWKKYAIAAAAGLVLVLLIYYGAQRGPSGKKIAEPSRVIVDEGEKPAGSLLSGAETPRQPAGKKPVRGEALVLTVPKERAIEGDVYLVRKGDTLWAICKRFTGNPLSYPRVARDNSIANPDLIFPGQKIYLNR